tara:strand:+ start:436 stop:1029 length:594 start_codon:yes stop_codon:yes gene_type:complete
MLINSSSYTSAIPVALSDTINIPGPVVRFSGTTSSLTNDKLVDTTGGFLQVVDANGNITNQGVQTGQIVYNMAAINTTAWLGPEAAVVTAVDSDTVLSLSANIFPVTGAPSTTQEYTIYNANAAQLKGFMVQVGSAADGSSAAGVYVKTIDGQDVFLEGIQPGTVLPLVVQRVMVGTAATTGTPNTLTDAENIFAYS